MFKNWAFDDTDKAEITTEEAIHTLNSSSIVGTYVKNETLEKTLINLSSYYGDELKNHQRVLDSYIKECAKLKFYQLKKKKLYKDYIERLRRDVAIYDEYVKFITKLYGCLFEVYDC